MLMSTVKSEVNFLIEDVIYKVGRLLCLVTATACGPIKHS
jgi:hypothetical protein